MPHFDALKIYSCGKHCEKRKNCLSQAISPFLTMFSILYGTYFSFYMHFKMSFAICFNLDQSKILLSGNGITFGLELTLSKLCGASYLWVKSESYVYRFPNILSTSTLFSEMGARTYVS